MRLATADRRRLWMGEGSRSEERRKKKRRCSTEMPSARCSCGDEGVVEVVDGKKKRAGRRGEGV
jgi:hypothetical protein